MTRVLHKNLVSATSRCDVPIKEHNRIELHRTDDTSIAVHDVLIKEKNQIESSGGVSLNNNMSNTDDAKQPVKLIEQYTSKYKRIVSIDPPGMKYKHNEQGIRCVPLDPTGSKYEIVQRETMPYEYKWYQ